MTTSFTTYEGEVVLRDNTTRTFDDIIARGKELDDVLAKMGRQAAAIGPQFEHIMDALKTAPAGGGALGELGAMLSRTEQQAKTVELALRNVSQTHISTSSVDDMRQRFDALEQSIKRAMSAMNTMQTNAPASFPSRPTQPILQSQQTPPPTPPAPPAAPPPPTPPTPPQRPVPPSAVRAPFVAQGAPTASAAATAAAIAAGNQQQQMSLQQQQQANAVAQQQWQQIVAATNAANASGQTLGIPPTPPPPLALPYPQAAPPPPPPTAQAQAQATQRPHGTSYSADAFAATNRVGLNANNAERQQIWSENATKAGDTAASQKFSAYADAALTRAAAAADEAQDAARNAQRAHEAGATKAAEAATVAQKWLTEAEAAAQKASAAAEKAIQNADNLVRADIAKGGVPVEMAKVPSAADVNQAKNTAGDFKRNEMLALEAASAATSGKDYSAAMGDARQNQLLSVYQKRAQTLNPEERFARMAALREQQRQYELSDEQRDSLLVQQYDPKKGEGVRNFMRAAETRKAQIGREISVLGNQNIAEGRPFAGTTEDRVDEKIMREQNAAVIKESTANLKAFNKAIADLTAEEKGSKNRIAGEVLRNSSINNTGTTSRIERGRIGGNRTLSLFGLGKKNQGPPGAATLASMPIEDQQQYLEGQELGGFSAQSGEGGQENTQEYLMRMVQRIGSRTAYVPPWMAQAVPGFSKFREASMLARLAPQSMAGAAVGGAAIGGLSAVAVASVKKGIDEVIDSMERLEKKDQALEKLGKRFEDARGVVSNLNKALGETATSAQSIALLQDMPKNSIFNNEQVLTGVASYGTQNAYEKGATPVDYTKAVMDAVNAGNGQALEQMGAITSATSALIDYVEDNNAKNPDNKLSISTLTPEDIARALMSAVLQQGVMEAKPPSDVEQFRTEQQRTDAGLSELSTQFGDLIATIIDPEATSGISLYTSLLKRFNDSVWDGVDALDATNSAKRYRDSGAPQEQIDLLNKIDAANGGTWGKGDLATRTDGGAGKYGVAGRIISAPSADILAQQSGAFSTGTDTQTLLLALQRNQEQGRVDVSKTDEIGANVDLLPVYGQMIKEAGSAFAEALGGQEYAQNKLSNAQSVLADRTVPGAVQRPDQVEDARRDVAAAEALVVEANRQRAIAENALSQAATQQIKPLADLELETILSSRPSEVEPALEQRGVELSGMLEPLNELKGSLDRFSNTLASYDVQISEKRAELNGMAAGGASGTPEFKAVEAEITALRAEKAAATTEFEQTTLTGFKNSTLPDLPANLEGAQTYATERIVALNKVIDDVIAALARISGESEEEARATIGAPTQAEQQAIRAGPPVIGPQPNQAASPADGFVFSSSSGGVGTGAKEAEAATVLHTNAIIAEAKAMDDVQAANAAYMVSLTQGTQQEQDRAAAAKASADASLAQAQAMIELTNTTRGVTVVNGQVVDSQTGLMVSFDAVALAADKTENGVKRMNTAWDTYKATLAGVQAANQQAVFAQAAGLVGNLGVSGAMAYGSRVSQGVETLTNDYAQKSEAAGRPYDEDLLNNYILQPYISGQMQQQQFAISQSQQKGPDFGKQVEGALNGLISSVSQPTTSGLINTDEILGREDEVDEKARRMADVAVKGFQSPWYEGLKDMFPQEVLDQGEEGVKKSAAKMVKDHQSGLTTMFMDQEKAAQQVIEKIKGNQETEKYVDEVRAKVKEQLGAATGSELTDEEIMKMLGMDTSSVSSAANGPVIQSLEDQQKAIDDLLAGKINPVSAAVAQPLTDETKKQIKDGPGGQVYPQIALGIAEDLITPKLIASTIALGIIGGLEEKKADFQVVGMNMTGWLTDSAARNDSDKSYVGARVADSILGGFAGRKEEFAKIGVEMAGWLATSVKPDDKSGDTGSTFVDAMTASVRANQEDVKALGTELAKTIGDAMVAQMGTGGGDYGYGIANALASGDSTNAAAIGVGGSLASTIGNAMVLQMGTAQGDYAGKIVQQIAVGILGLQAMADTAGVNIGRWIGEAMVMQTDASHGNYGARIIGNVTTAFAAKKDSVEQSGRDVALWLGDALLAKFGEEVPAGLVDILVTELVPAMKSALDADKKRESGNGGTTGGFGGQ